MLRPIFLGIQEKLPVIILLSDILGGAEPGQPRGAGAVRHGFEPPEPRILDHDQAQHEPGRAISVLQEDDVL